MTMAMKMLEMPNMIMLEKKRDAGWTTGKHNVVYEKIKARFAPNDEVAEMDTDDNMRKIKLPQPWDPKKLLDNITAVEVQYGWVLSKPKKVIVVI